MPRQQRITLSIPKPCHEGWENMTPMARGRYCASCEKLVTDFTQQSPAEISAYLARHPKENLCGRFTQAQLGVLYTLEPERRPAAWPKWLVAAGLLGGMVVPKVGSGQRIESTHQLSKNDSIKIIEDDIYTIEGQLLGYNQDTIPLIGATVALIHLPTNAVLSGTFTDAAGTFTLSYYIPSPKKDYAIRFSHIEYEVLAINLDSILEHNSSHTINLGPNYLAESGEEVFMGIICRRGDIRPRNPFGFTWYYIKYPFKHTGRAVASVFRRRY